MYECVRKGLKDKFRHEVIREEVKVEKQLKFG
jgi:hypothetical protein